MTPPTLKEISRSLPGGVDTSDDDDSGEDGEEEGEGLVWREQVRLYHIPVLTF